LTLLLPMFILGAKVMVKEKKVEGRGAKKNKTRKIRKIIWRGRGREREGGRREREREKERGRKRRKGGERGREKYSKEVTGRKRERGSEGGRKREGDNKTLHCYPHLHSTWHTKYKSYKIGYNSRCTGIQKVTCNIQKVITRIQCLSNTPSTIFKGKCYKL
jgi:hypothetical protein